MVIHILSSDLQGKRSRQDPRDLAARRDHVYHTATQCLFMQEGNFSLVSYTQDNVASGKLKRKGSTFWFTLPLAQ
ncbi:hypothetical protein KSC_010920 [Ktedonobacter sp. SOSP1-52]|nr:hypothetical protein KSC_010920 [Ktedonobacter sp. SOSP1-52]